MDMHMLVVWLQDMGYRFLFLCQAEFLNFDLLNGNLSLYQVSPCQCYACMYTYNYNICVYI